MTVAELIEALREYPDQRAPAIFTYASETDGSLVIAEVEGLEPRTVYRDVAGLLTEYTTQTPVEAVELL